MVFKAQVKSINMKHSVYYYSILALFILGCQARENHPGYEYAPQMYHSVAYDPLSQIVDEPKNILQRYSYHNPNTNPYNDYNGEKHINLRLPPEGTVKRQNYRSATNSNIIQKGNAILFYDMHKDSTEYAAKIWKNPLDSTEENLAEGKHLYLAFCSACHGEAGNGQGKVGNVYKGVPNYSAGRYATLSPGHIFHVITHGKNTMWSHKSQLNPEERWKVVLYVQQLQKGNK
jgi:cytochrome c5